MQKALDTLDEVTGIGDSVEKNQDDAWSAVAGGTETGIDVTYQDITNDVDFIVDVTPSSGNATLEISEDAIQVKYDSTDFVEGANGLYLGASPTITTSLAISNILIGTNDISSTAGTDLTITPLNGQQIVLDGAIVVDAGVVTGATSITSDVFVGPLTGAVTGNVTGNVSGTALTVTQAAQAAITSLGTLTTLSIDNITINGNDISSTAGTDLTITPLEGQQIVLDGTIVVDAGVVTGITTLAAPTMITMTAQADPTTDTDGQIALDTDGWGTGYDAFEVFNGTASAYLVATTASDAPSDGQVPKWNTGGTITWEDDDDSAGTPTVITVADSTDTSSSIAFFESATVITVGVPAESSSSSHVIVPPVFHFGTCPFSGASEAVVATRYAEAVPLNTSNAS